MSYVFDLVVNGEYTWKLSKKGNTDHANITALLVLLSSYFYFLYVVSNIIILCACETPLEPIWTPFPLFVSFRRAMKAHILLSESASPN